jgi:hypothetical protein
MFKVVTSCTKVIVPARRCFQSSNYTCRLVSIPQKYQTHLQFAARSIGPYIRCLPSWTNVRSCHAKSPELTPREKLKKAAKEYGSVLIAFHVGISLISLGTVYFLISNGVDVQQWIGWMGMSNADESTKIVAGASQFIIAYAIHKSFAPVRISITLVSVPLIVRYLRSKGIMKMK